MAKIFKSLKICEKWITQISPLSFRRQFGIKSFLESIIWLQKSAFFRSSRKTRPSQERYYDNYYYIYLERTLIPLLIVIKRWTWYQNAWKNVQNTMKEKIWRLYVAKCQNAQKTRAHAHLSDFLSNAPYGLKRMQKKLGMIWSFLNFCAHVNARKNAYSRICACFLIRNWPEGYWSYSW